MSPFCIRTHRTPAQTPMKNTGNLEKKDDVEIKKIWGSLLLLSFNALLHAILCKDTTYETNRVLILIPKSQFQPSLSVHVHMYVYVQWVHGYAGHTS